MRYPKAYIVYLVHFHGDRDFFECHEILEEHWKEVDPKDRNSYWIGFIQLAVALYHDRRENKQGAIRTIIKAVNNLSYNRNKLDQLGLEVDNFFLLLKQTQERMIAGKAFENMNLPLNDTQLISQCIDECKKSGLTWRMDHSLVSPHIIHKHLRRDRSKVIEERARQIEIRKLKNRG